MRKIIAICCILCVSANLALAETIVIDSPSATSVIGSDSTGNTITVNAKVDGHVFGSETTNAVSSENNAVTIHSEVTSAVHGGQVSAMNGGTVSGSVANNTLTIGAGANLSGFLHDGKEGAIGGEIKIGPAYSPTDAAVSGSVYGNTVEFQAGSSQEQVIGGQILVDANSQLNSLDITQDAEVKNNTINISGGSISRDVYGGKIRVSNLAGNGNYAVNGTISNNNVTFTDGILTDQIVGGALEVHDIDGSGNFNIDSDVTGNEVTIAGGSLSTPDNKAFMGGNVSVSFAARDNQSLNMDVATNNNTLSVTGGTFYSPVLMSGGLVFLQNKGDSALAPDQTLITADNNSLNISNMSLNGQFFGGYLSAGETQYGGNSMPDYSVTGHADGNNITIASSNINGQIAGGAFFGSLAETSSTATNNTINVSGNTQFGADTVIYGGLINNSSADSFSGNTLNWQNTTSQTIHGLNNFENYSFDLSSAKANDTILTVTHGKGLDVFGEQAGAININGSSVDITNAVPSLNIGEGLTLLKETGGYGFSGTLANTQDTTTAGDITYHYKVNQTENQIDLFHNGAETTGNWTDNVNLIAGNKVGEDVFLFVDGTLQAENISVNSSENATASLTAGTLDVTNNNTLLALNNTTEWNGTSGVHFNTIKIGNGYELTKQGNGFYSFEQLTTEGESSLGSLDAVQEGANSVFTVEADSHANISDVNIGSGSTLTIDTSSGGTYDFDQLTIWGTDATLDLTDDMDASNKSLTFVLDNVSAGNSMLNVTNGNINIEGSNIAIANNPALSLGEDVTLIASNNVIGTAANDYLSFQEGNASYRYILYPGSLHLFAQEQVINGDYEDDDITIKAGDSAGLDVNFTVNGELRTDNLSAASTAQSSANVNVQALDVTNQDTTVTLTDTSAWNGAKGVLFNSINIGPNRTLAMAGNGKYAYNTLNVYGTNAVFDGNLDAANKQMNFYLSDNTTAGEQVLNVTGTADISNSIVKVGVQGDSSSLNEGDKLVLINSTSLAGDPASMTGVGMQGLTLQYDFDLQTTPTQLIASVAEVSVRPESKAFSEGSAASLAFLSQGSDFIADNALQAAANAVQLKEDVGVFGTTSAGKSRYQTGSYVDINGLNTAAGLARKFGNLTAAFFAEYGNGSYDSNNDFSVLSIKANGDTTYGGGGLLGRFDWNDSFYAEASARIGQVDTDFSSQDFTGGADYDYNSLYYGSHIGGGYLWQVNPSVKLDLYAKYLWTHTDAKDVTVSSGDQLSFQANDSQRAKIGIEANFITDSVFSPYIGAAYDYEFDGDAKAKTGGLDIQAPSLKGGNVMGELGLSWKYKYMTTMSLAVQGYAGRREGFSGNFQISYIF